MHYSSELVSAIAQGHGLEGDVSLMPASGMVNEAWAIGDRYVCRIVFQDECEDEAAREALVVPIAMQHGIRTPRLVAADVSCELAPKPYTIYERATGTLQGFSDLQPSHFEAAHREIGLQFAVLHQIPLNEDLAALLDHKPWEPRPRESLAKSKSAGLVTDDEEAQVLQLFEVLESHMGEMSQKALIHHDVHPWNVFVDEPSGSLTAIIDWGDTSWGDPAYDFASMPIQALKPMLEAYAETHPVDQSLVARALYVGAALALWELRELTEEFGKRQWWRMPPAGISQLCEDARNALKML
ncbi:MAG TPA: aminoglycoside phosphotransferase family protein [Fimbriimonadaceae bacterium]|nr:aminoglycoside phosphotransferase family protein [Fimbriimonadaceae bacterium]